MNDHVQQHRQEYDATLYNYEGWRSALWPDVLRRVNPSDINDHDIYMFGVFGGKTTIEWCNILRSLDLHPRKIICFDSFEGIPIEEAEPVQDGWHPGKSAFFAAFNAKQYFETGSVAEAVERFRSRITPQLPEGTELEVVPGFFNESLTRTLALDINRPGIVDIDVDIYSSTKDVLHWLLSNHLLIHGTTMVGYDDWGGTPGYMDRLDGESRAHREFEELYNLDWKLIGATGEMQQTIFRLEKK